MAKGIQGISFLDHPIESGQIIRLPNLKNCTVYGLMANGLQVSLIADIESETYKRLKTLGEDSQVKWVVGKVNHLGKGGMDWVRIYTDTNNNRKKDPNEKWKYDNKGKKLEKISKTDLYNIGNRYERTDILPVWFPKAEKFKPTIYWIEPFLIHPELHFSKVPKGFFLISIDKPQPYEACISGKNFNRVNIFKELTNKKESDGLEFYYGDTLELEVTTVQIPDFGKLLIEIYNSEDKLVSDPEMSILVKKQHISVFNDTELNKYAQEIYKVGTLNIPLNIEFKPKSQQKKTTDYLRFKISYKPSVEHQFYEKDPTTIVRDNIPDIPEHVKIQAGEMSRKIKDSIESLKSKEYKQQEKANQPEDIPLDGYVAVYFNDTKSYINDKESRVNKMVEVGAESLIVPENEPCHYTQIKAQRYKNIDFKEKEKGEVVIFDEFQRVQSDNQPIISLIAGDAIPGCLSLIADLDTQNTCRAERHNNGGANVFKFTDKYSSQAQGMEIIQLSEDEIKLTAPYIYIKDSGILFPWNYFWLSKTDKQSYGLFIETCRYRNDVKICVYPDIKWEVYILIVPTEKDSYAHTNMPAGDIFKRHQDKARKTGLAHHNKSIDYTTEIHVKYTLSGNSYDFGIDINKKVRKYLELIGAVKNVLDIISHKQAVTNGAGSNAQKMIAKVGKKTNLPVFIDFSLPALRVGGSWSYILEENLASGSGSIEIGLTPLIKAKGGIDLIATAQYIPYVGAVLKALGYVQMGVEWVTDKAGVPVTSELWFNIYAFGQVDATWIIDLSTGAGEPNCKVTLGLGIELGFKVEARVKKVVLVNGEDEEKGVGVKGQLSGEAETGLTLSVKSPGLMKAKGSVSFLGIRLKLVGELGYRREKGRFQSLPKPKGTFQIVDAKPNFTTFDFDLNDFIK